MRPARHLLLCALLLGSAGPGHAEAPPRRAPPARPAVGASAAPGEAAPARTASATTEAPPRSGPRGRGRRTLRGVININQADQATLELLPGVGEVTASKIIEHRRSHPFRRVEDITRVKGIGRKKLARMRPYLNVGGPTTLTEEDAGAPVSEPAEP